MKDTKELAKIIEKNVPKDPVFNSDYDKAISLLEEIESDLKRLQEENQELESRYRQLHSITYGFAESFKNHHAQHFPSDPEY